MDLRKRTTHSDLGMRIREDRKSVTSGGSSSVPYVELG
jgi:hypothetical protein